MTQAMLTRWLGALLTLGLLALPVRAEQPKAAAAKGSQPYVVLVGISNYADKQIKPRAARRGRRQGPLRPVHRQGLSRRRRRERQAAARQGRRQDAAASRPRARTSSRRCKWLADERQARRPGHLRLLRRGRAARRARRPPLLLRHRLDVQGPRQGRRRRRRDRRRARRSSRASASAVFLDVNFKGFDDGKDDQVAEPTLGKAPTRSSSATTAPRTTPPLPGRVVFLATNGLTPSLDLKEHGLFTTGRARRPEGRGRQGGLRAGRRGHRRRADRRTSTRSMPELAREHGKTKEEKEQHALRPRRPSRATSS